MSDCKCSCHEDKCCGCQKRLESERDRLKAELENDKWANDLVHKDRDLWKSKYENEEHEWVKMANCYQTEKSKAEKLAEALRSVAKHAVHTYWEDRGSDLLEHSLDCANCKAKAALAEFEEEK